MPVDPLVSTIIAVCNQKGGVGKTEIAIHLAAALACANFGKNGTKKCYDPNINENVGLVDLDPQGHTTEGVGLRELYDKSGITLYDGLTQYDVPVPALIHDVPHESFYLIPRHYKMMLVESKLHDIHRQEYHLSDLLGGVSGAFDWIIIDCPPNLGY